MLVKKVELLLFGFFRFGMSLKMKAGIRLLLTWLVVFRGHGLNAQYSLELAAVSGKMLAHSVYNTNLDQRRSMGLQASTVWLLPNDTGLLLTKSQKHRYLGFSILAMDMGDGLLNGSRNDRQALVPMGTGIAALSISGAKFTIPPTLGFNSLQMQWGFGLLHLSEFYDSVSNPKNLAMSSSMNFAAQWKVQAIRHVSPQSTVTLGLEMFHTSNSNWQKPNVGLNYYQLSLGLVHRFHPGRHTDKDPCFWKGESIKQLSAPYQISLKYAYRKYRRDFPVYYSIYIAEASWGLPNHYRLSEYKTTAVGTSEKKDGIEDGVIAENNSKSKTNFAVGMPKGEWRFGVNVFYENSANGRDASGGLYTLDSRLEVGAFARRVMRFGPLDVFLDFGLYALPPKSDRMDDLEKTRWFYNAIGTQYRINDRWMLVHRLKAHYHVADYMEFGLIFLFK